MNYFEKILFIDLTCHQLGIPDSNHPEFISTWDNLSGEEKNNYAELSNKIHQVYSYINMPLVVPIPIRVNSISEYNELVNPVDKIILTVCSDFGITLKEELTEEFKATAKRIFGKDYFDWFEK